VTTPVHTDRDLHTESLLPSSLFATPDSTKSSPQTNADARIRTEGDRCYRDPARSYWASALRDAPCCFGSGRVYTEHDGSTLTGDTSERTAVVSVGRRIPSRNTSGHHGRGDPFFWVGRCHCDGAPPSSPPWKAVSDREGVAHPGRSMT
jgi:hypothetical protein